MRDEDGARGKRKVRREKEETGSKIRGGQRSKRIGSEGEGKDKSRLCEVMEKMKERKEKEKMKMEVKVKKEVKVRKEEIDRRKR